MTDQELEARFHALEDRFDRLVSFLGREFEAARQQLDNTREELRRELGAVERRVGHLGELAAALVRYDGTAEVEMKQIRGTQAGQQRFIEEMDRRLRRLEEKNGSGQKP